MDGDLAVRQRSRLEVSGKRLYFQKREPYQHHAMPSCVYNRLTPADATRVSISRGEDYVA